MKKDTGGPAFPADPFLASVPGNADEAKRIAEGMTLRDYFAAKAMQGMYSNPHIVDTLDAGSSIASQAYRIADAMLSERAK